MAFSVLSNPHSKAIRCYSYELYIDREIGLEVEDDGMSLDEFISANPIVVSAPCHNETPVFNYPIVGSKKTTQTYPVSPDPAKKFIFSLIAGVKLLVAQGKCFAPFDEKNIIVSPSGDALFKHLDVIQFSHSAKRAVYQSITKLARRLFAGKPIPQDIEHLIDLIERNQQEDLYAIHTSLVPHRSRAWCFLNMHELVIHKLQDVERQQILLKLPYVLQWRTIVHKNDVLYETYNFKSSKAYAQLPSHTEWTENQQKIHEARMLLDFIRNGISHRMQRQIGVTPEEHETIIYVFFPLLLPKLQQAILEVLGVRGLRLVGLI